MVLLVAVCVKALERFLLFKTFTTKEKVVTILAYVTILDYLHFACKTLVLLLLIDLRLENHLHLMVRFVIS